MLYMDDSQRLASLKRWDDKVRNLAPEERKELESKLADFSEEVKAMLVPDSDPLLNGTQPCGTCGIAGQITYEPGDGYSCGNCLMSD